jgi:uncharacterized membrane protein YfcA
MEYDVALQALVAFLASLSTFFTGFGLGTVMLPVFLLTYDLHTAVLATAIIHLSNNIFKFILMRKHVDYRLLFSFGIMSFLFAFIGANLLNYLTGYEDFLQITLGIIILIFAIIDLFSLRSKISKHAFNPYIGGAVSGFFGGLSGHQGAIRSAFLINIIKDKSIYIATGTVLSLIIDLTRIPVYTMNDNLESLDTNSLIVVIGAAITGAIIGKKFLTKTSNQIIHKIVGIALLAFAVYMIFSV